MISHSSCTRQRSDDGKSRESRNATHIRYRYTSFFWSRSAVAMFFRTSGNKADTSLPRVMDMMVFWIASLLGSCQHGRRVAGWSADAYRS